MSVQILTGPADIAGNAGNTLTTASFNVPAQSYVVVMAGCDNAASVATSATISDNHNGTWTLLKRQATLNQGTAEIWGAFYKEPQTGLTVQTIFTNGFSSPTDAVISVRVLSGAASSQPGATAAATGTVDTVALVPLEVGSLVFGMLCRPAGATSYAANAQSQTLKLNADATSGSTQWSFAGLVPTTSLASVTYGSSTAAATSTDICVVEIRPSNGLSNNYQSVKSSGLSVTERIR